MDRSSSATGSVVQQTGIGLSRSCLTCAKAKSKCLPQEGAKGACQRCTRLGKECLRKEAVVRRKKPEKATRAAQLQKLESKLDHLVNALSSANPPLPVVSAMDSPVSSIVASTTRISTMTPPAYQTITPARSVEYSQPSPGFHRSSNQGRKSNGTNDVLDTMCSGNNQEFDEATTQNPQYAEHVSISQHEADLLLNRYIRLMASHMPFVVFPADSTPRTLYETNPLLLRAVVTVALFHDLPRQRSCVKDLIREIGERIMVKGERSVDLLQCIMVLVAWYYPHAFSKPVNQMTMLLHLAIALTVDTAIDRPAQKVDASRTLSEQAQDLAKHRILLGVFYYTSTMGTNFGNKMSALTYTPYMEQCLSIVETSRACESDIHLVHTVRTQQLIGTIVSTSMSHVPSKVYMASIRADIDNIRQDEWSSQNQGKLDDDVSLRFHRLTAELHAWEVILADLFENHSNILTKHLEAVYGCIDTIQAIFDLFHAMPVSDYFIVTFSVFDHFVYGILTFTKLALIGAEPWIRSALNEKMRFSETLESFCSKFEHAGRSSPDGLQIDNQCFSAWAKKLRYATQAWAAKVPHQIVAASPHVDKGSEDGHGDRLARILNEVGQPTPAESLDNADFFNYLDGNFWDSFGGELDFGSQGADTFS